MSDKHIRLIVHCFTPEQAEAASHLPFYLPQPLAKIARKAGKAPAEIQPALDALAARKIILKTRKGYSLLPLIPGMFERVLINGADSDWHKKYSELLLDLYSTGYVREYNRTAIPLVRNLPVQKAVEAQNRVATADLVSEMIGCHQEFAIANVCQCRQSMRFIGKDCKRARPEDGCLIFGSYAKMSAEGGNARMVDRQEMKEAVAERFEKKLVFFTANIAPENANAICTCCDCCCHFVESVNNWNGKAGIAPAHFLARIDQSLCDDCGKCLKPCNTLAHLMEKKKHRFFAERCIGCGNCLSSCKNAAISLVENPSYKSPAAGFRALGIKSFPAISLTGIKVRLRRD